MFNIEKMCKYILKKHMYMCNIIHIYVLKMCKNNGGDRLWNVMS